MKKKKKKKQIRRKRKTLFSKFTDEYIQDVFNQSLGLRPIICQKLNVTEWQLEKYLRDNRERKQWLEDSRMGIVHQAEIRILELLNSKDPKVQLEASKFVLARLGKNKGWASSDIDRQIIQLNYTPEEKRNKINEIFSIDFEEDKEDKQENIIDIIPNNIEDIEEAQIISEEIITDENIE